MRESLILLDVEPELQRDAVIVGVLGLLLLTARVPFRWVVLILALAVGVTVLLDAFIDGLTGTG